MPLLLRIGEAMDSRCEISISSGRSKITLKGPDAIRAAGWSLRFLLFARGASFFFVGGVLAVYALFKLWW
jgi:hypothetical protein